MSLNHQHTNRLIKESSTYLLQHAHNPVDWHPWGEEALNKAKAEDKPILLSIGYAACHWCHVMEKESFEDTTTAEFMNKYFINIKVDREERPDIDHIYMDAVQAMTGSGGWPLNVFLTPDLKPFYGGTYFPPVNAYNRLSWKEVMARVHQAYNTKKEEITEQAGRLTDHLINSNLINIGQGADEAPFTEEDLQTIADNMLKNADTEWGGFGKAPKFPQSFVIQYLLRHYHYTKHQASLDQATLSLDKMIYGGIYDQIGGGFSRYSTDDQWLAPHFEKMLYDNALLISVLAEAYQITGKELYADTIRQTIAFLKREMMHPDGGFYSALDADSEGVEGKYYTWSRKEIEEILGEDAVLFCNYYQVTENGNWEHTNILWCTDGITAFASLNSLDNDYITIILKDSAAKLLEEREKRIRPQLDDKILTGWNALMITALCKAADAFKDTTIKQMAIDCMGFMEDRLIVNGSLLHTYKDGIAKIDAFLDDYAYLIQSYIALNNCTGNNKYLDKAISLVSIVDERFKDAATGLYYYTPKEQQHIIVRKKELYDGAIPSGNSVMFSNLLYLSSLIDNDSITFKNGIISIISGLRKAIVQYPTSFAIWAMNVQLIVKDIKEINIYTDEEEGFIAVIAGWYIPEKIIKVNITNISDVFPRGNSTLNLAENPYKSSTFSVCAMNTCSRFFTNLTDFYNYLTKG